MYINHNISAMNSQRHVFDTNNSLDKTLERLSSGLRINSGADDASGLAIAEKMAAQNAGLDVASQNAQDGQALYKIAEGALAQVTAMLTRMEELAVRATNGTLTTSDRTAITDEIGELNDQINKISQTTEYNTLKVLNGSMAVEMHQTITTGVQDSMRIMEGSAVMKNANNYAFIVTSVASAATISGVAAGTASASMSGVININGFDIAIASGDTVATAVAKINAQNDATHVVALTEDVNNTITLVSGILDTDAGNILPGSASNIIGYALVGSSYTVNLTGNATVLANIGLTAGAVSGSNATGTMDGTNMTSVGGLGGGSILEDTNLGSATFGLKIQIDTFNGANGVYLMNKQAAVGASYVHQSQINDASTVEVKNDARLKLQIGANYEQAIYNTIGSISTSNLGIGGASKFGSLDAIKLDTVVNANISLKTIQQAIVDVTGVRSKVGATMNRLDYTIRTIGIQRENMTSALSRIQDADISQEMTTFTKQQIMLQAGTAMLAQANARPQAVLQLLK